MKEEEILKLLQAKNKNLQLPSGMGFSIEDKTLTIAMKEKGMIANMQTDASAFEGWAICLKAWLPELIDDVNIEREKPIDSSDQHYQRLLYRLDKFTTIYSWAHTTSFKEEIDNFRKKNGNVFINVPKSKASKSAAHCEAQLERTFCQENKDKFDVIDHQLPVRLFNDEIKEDNAITPKSYLDIWSIKDTLLRIFELKLPTNTEIGIISELMFYVNVMTVVINGKITIPLSSEDKSYRSFKQLFDFQKNKKCKKIEGVFLADNLHSGIKNKLEEVLHIINGGNFGFNIEYLYEKPRLVDVTITKDDIKENIDMKKEKSYKQLQKEQQLTLLQHSDFFEDAIGCGIWWNNKNNKWETYPHILQHQDSLKNLYEGIRKEVMSYFKEYDIAWWREDDDRYFPTGNLLSSQIHCLNHLFKLRRDPYAVLSIIKNVCPNVVRVLPSPIDDHDYSSKKSNNIIKSYISFEFTYNNVDLLKERTCKRGKDCTSIDAFVYAVDKEGNHVLIAIEWKYTEVYAKFIDKKTYKKIVHTVKERYLDKIATIDSHLTSWEKSYYLDPFYELARQSLLMEQIINKKPFPAAYYQHIVVCPTDNIEMRADAKTFKDSLSENGNKLFHIIDPKDFLAPVYSLKDKKGRMKYADLFTYLETRYWK